MWLVGEVGAKWNMGANETLGVYSWRGPVFATLWLSWLTSAAWHIKIKLIDDHIINTTQKRHFLIFMNFDWSMHSHFCVDCLDKVSHKTADYCWIESLACFIILSLFWQSSCWYYSRYGGLYSNLIPGVTWHTALRGKITLCGQHGTLEYWATIAGTNYVAELLNVGEYNYLPIFHIFTPFWLRPGQNIYSWYDLFIQA